MSDKNMNTIVCEIGDKVYTMCTDFINSGLKGKESPEWVYDYGPLILRYKTVRISLKINQFSHIYEKLEIIHMTDNTVFVEYETKKKKGIESSGTVVIPLSEIIQFDFICERDTWKESKVANDKI